MRTRMLVGAIAALALVTTSCTDSGSVPPGLAPVPGASPMSSHLPVRISEIHYDNTGTDAGEAIEVSGPAGTDLTGWSIVLYNGSPTSRLSYGTTALSGSITASCGDRGVVVVTYPSNGIQNGGAGAAGEPDGVALVNASGAVVEFLSYEGSFIAANGPASGMTSTNINAFEAGTEVIGLSLKRSGADVWSGPTTASFGTCNDNDATPVAVASVSVEPATATIVAGATQQLTATARAANGDPIGGAAINWSTSNAAVATVDGTGLVTAVAEGTAQVTATSAINTAAASSATITVTAAPTGQLPDVKLTEIHYDNASTDVGEAIEVTGPAGTNLSGWKVELYNGNGGALYGTIALSGVLADQCSGRGTSFVPGPAGGIQNGNPDGFALIGPGGEVVEFLSYGGTFAATSGTASGRTSVDIGRAESGSTPIGQSLQRASDGSWYGPATSSMGACNPDVPPPPPQFISFTGREASDPALPVGFEDQLFANLVVGGVNTPTTITWLSETPGIATVDQDGVMRAVGVGTAVIRATAADGTTRTYSLPTRVATMSATAQYGSNTEFGEPTDGTPADDLIIRRAQLTSSFNTTRNIPNWVAYNIDATHFGPEDRCECFTYDPELPVARRYTTADYTGAGAFHGYGIDRGHLARSFDRTAGSLDNAHTFYFSNIIPQASDNNQGPWAALESYLGNLATSSNREVFVIAGASGTKGTVKNEGLVTIPAVTWKVALVLPRDQGLAHVTSASSLVEVIAVVMPNDAGIRNTPWQTFATTVDVVEQVSGYDLLALLRDDIEIAVESNTSKPAARTSGPYTVAEGGSLTVSGATSTDADAGQALAYAWTFGDGGTATGVAPSHVYAQDGSYAIRLIVTDPLGLADTTTTTATVTNVAPAIAAFAGATLLPGETYATTGSFTDPGADTWTATVNYGIGGTVPLTLSGKSFSLSKLYPNAGSFTVTVAVSDDDVTSSATATVTVLTHEQGVQRASAALAALVAAGTLTEAEALPVAALVRDAERLLAAGRPGRAVEQLLEQALVGMARLRADGTLTASEAATVSGWIERVLASVLG